MALHARLRVVRPRQALFFLLAIVLPCALLVVLTTRMWVQERELAEKRQADERRRIAADLRQALVARVERIRLDSSRSGSTTPNHPQLALLARTENGRLVLPWEEDASVTAAAAALAEPRFAGAVRAGERAEFIDGRLTEAAAAYQRAVVAARLPVQHAAAQLLLGRTLSKSGRQREAETAYQAVLGEDADIVDDQGIPFALYAARRLLDTPAIADDTVDRVVATVAAMLASPAFGPAASYMARDVVEVLQKAASTAARERAAELSASLAARNADIEQALELQKVFPATVVSRRSTASPTGQSWFPFGPIANRWLVSAGSAPADDHVVVVRADAVLRSALDDSPIAANDAGHIALSTSGDGEPLLPGFPGLTIVIPTAIVSAVARDNGLQRPIVVVALVVVLSTAFFGAYLLWRDVQREIRLAELRSQFVASVSHELKTPLTAIRMFAETLLLGRATRPEVSHEYLETIVNESERLTRLLNNMLDFSKIEQGTKTYRLAPQSPASMVSTVVNAMQYPLAQQGFELRVRVDERVPPISADPDAIQQALLNLLSNAMKYSGAGRIIDLELLQDNGQAVIAVTDRGIGIPPGEQKRIFEKFYRVPGVENQQIAGTGLGLTLADHVARAHGGRVTVNSTPGAGSTFALVLPLAESRQSDTAARVVA